MAKKLLIAALVGVLVFVPLLALLGVMLFANPALTSYAACGSAGATPTTGPLAKDAPVPERARAWIRQATRECPDLPEVWIAAVMYQESNFRPEVFAPDVNGGTWGLLQLNRYIWQDVYGPWDTDRDANGVWDVKQPMIHAKYGARYLCQLLEQVRETRRDHPDWESTTELTELEALVVAHNGGPGRLSTYPDIAPVTRAYLQDVRRHMQEWAAPISYATTASTGGTDQAAGEASEVVMPIPRGQGTITSTYGYRRDPFGTGERVLHHGLDFGAEDGTPILAVAEGTVVQAEMVPGDAGTIVIEHQLDNQVVATLYKHMWADGIHVQPGDTVTAGQHIGDVGSSGNSTGPHLHLEVRPGGAHGDTIDPQPWLARHHAVTIDAPHGQASVGCETSTDELPGPPTPFRGQPGGRLEDPTGTGGWITHQTKHFLGEVRRTFPEPSWSCWYQSSGGEHPVGKACDATFGNNIGEYPTAQQEREGWRVAEWLQRYSGQLRIDYLIWQGQIWSVARADEGWREYDGGGFGDPDDVTAGHFDHLHVSVR